MRRPHTVACVLFKRNVRVPNREVVMFEYARLSLLHQRLWGTSTLMVVLTLIVFAWVWWRALPIGMLQHVLMRISMLLIASNSIIGVVLAFSHPGSILLHTIYGIVVFVPSLGVLFLTKYSNTSTHAMYYCIALGIVLLILHRLAVTAPH